MLAFIISMMLLRTGTASLSSTNGYYLWFSLYLASGTIVRILLRDSEFLNRSFNLIDYFVVLLFGYFNSTFFIEMVWIPYLLLEVIYLFPAVLSAVFIILLGGFGSIILSSSFLSGLILVVGNQGIKFTLLAVFYYTPICLLLLMILYQKSYRKHLLTENITLRAIKQKLESINRQVTNTMYRLRADSTAEERKRISKEIHDTAGYVFVNLIMMLQAVLAVIKNDKDKAIKIIQEARDYAEKGVNEIRYILREIRNTNPKRITLQNAFFDIGESFRKTTGVDLTIEYGNWPKSLPKLYEDFFVSFIQECLTNSLKHGNASGIVVICWMTESYITISVSDNGRGLSGVIVFGIGISSIKEFVDSKHGQITILSDQNGFRIILNIPVDEIFVIDKGQEIHD